LEAQVARTAEQKQLPGAGRRAFRLSRRLTLALECAAVQNETDLAGLLEAAWAVLLNRTRGEEEVAFRVWRLESADGVAVRIPVSSDAPLSTVVRVFAEARKNPVEATAARSLLAWDNVAIPSADCPLTLSVIPGERLVLELRHLAPTHDDDAARRLCGYLLTLLKGLAAAPKQPVGQLPILGRAERQRILVEWNATGEPAPPCCVHALFEEQAARVPDAEAVIFGDQRMTYRELNTRANQLAHHLRSLGVGPDVLVGLCLDRSPELFVGILGILKAGGAYVPLDPNYPAERLDFVLDDAGARVILTQRRDAARFNGKAAHVVCLDDDAVLAASTANPQPVAGPNHLIYVIYTSGSTGRPKGVAIEHRSVYQLVRWSEAYYSPEELSRIFFGVTVCFDMSVFEIFLPLCLGGAVVGAENALQLHQSPSANEVSMIITVPSVATEMLRSGGLPASLRSINLGGEALTEALVQQIYEQSQVSKVYNLYGPTETTVTCTAHWVHRDTQGAPSIGRPIGAARLYILDRARQPVPIGCPGELYIGGAGLARGYLNRPELNAERFVPDSFAGRSDARMYRTGDLCRHLPSGEIEYLSRIDHQVKVRGFRIELGEIEAALDQHPAVRQSVVMARDHRGGKELVAYVLAGDPVAPASELRSFLRQRLPAYMVPATYVILDTFPLSSSGKVDRAALPEPASYGCAGSSEQRPPRDDIERRLLMLWQECLGVSDIGIADEFFELGGNSLLAASLFARMEAAFGQRLPLSLLFQAATVEKLAVHLRTEREQRPPALMVPIQPRGTRTPFFAAPGRGGYGFEFRDLAQRLGPDQPFYSFSYERWDTNAKAESTLADMARWFIKIMRSVQPHGPYRLGGYCLGGWVAFAMAQELRAQGEETELLVLLDIWGPPILPYGRLPWPARLSTKWRTIRRLGLAGTARTLWQRFRPPTSESSTSDGWVYVPPGYPTGVYQLQTFPGRMHLFRGKQPDWYEKSVPHDPTLGWGALVRDGVDVHMFPGERTDLLQEPNVTALARQIEALLRTPARQQ
jgi:amino acid adenylation domain-containing protein